MSGVIFTRSGSWALPDAKELLNELNRCQWTWDNGVWATSCGNLFDLDAGSPKENDMKFCCYCGKPLEESWGE